MKNLFACQILFNPSKKPISGTVHTKKRKFDIKPRSNSLHEMNTFSHTNVFNKMLINFTQIKAYNLLYTFTWHYLLIAGNPHVCRNPSVKAIEAETAILIERA